MTRKINVPSDLTLTKGQERALQRIADQLASQRDTQAAGHDIVVSIDVHGTDYGNVWVKVTQDIPTLNDTNMLRVYTKMDSWYISVGPRGAMTARMVPNWARNMKKLGKIKIDLN